MPTPPLSDDLARAALAAFKEHGGKTLAARALGMHVNTFTSRLEVALERGLQLSDGARGVVQAAGLSGTEARGGWLHNYDDDGKKIGATYWKAPEGQTEQDQIERIRDAFCGMPAAPPIIQSEKSKEGKVGLFPHSDVHIGVDIDADRGGKAYTPEIAVERMKDGFAETHGALPPCETAIILNNGDLTHANDDRDVTVKNQHRLKVRGSHRSNLTLSVWATIWQIDLALQRSDRVIYRPNRGNHDPNTPDYLTIALSIYYRDEPRVTIDQSEREIWTYRQGLIFLAAWHGDKRKPSDICYSLPKLFPETFCLARHWYAVSGHLHEPKQQVFGAVHWWQLPSVCSLDQHAADAGYTDTSAVRAFLFCEQAGLKNDITVRL